MHNDCVTMHNERWQEVVVTLCQNEVEVNFQMDSDHHISLTEKARAANDIDCTPSIMTFTFILMPTNSLKADSFFYPIHKTIAPMKMTEISGSG